MILLRKSTLILLIKSADSIFKTPIFLTIFLDIKMLNARISPLLNPSREADFVRFFFLTTGFEENGNVLITTPATTTTEVVTPLQDEQVTG